MRAFVHLYTPLMHFVFLDEFGHIGPFVSRNHDQHNTSPVFGLAGFLMPDYQVRAFSTWFYQLKGTAFAADIEAASTHRGAWEKKGNSLFTHGTVYKKKRLAYSLLSEIIKKEGKIIYYGIEKYLNPNDHEPDRLYGRVLSRIIRTTGRYFDQVEDDYIIIIDEHPSRIKLMERALKTMYGEDRETTYRLIQPPFQVESHLYQTIQAADWIATIVGTLATYDARPIEYSDRQWAEKYFRDRLTRASTHSRIDFHPQPKTRRIV